MIPTWEGTNVYLLEGASPARDALVSALVHGGFRVEVFADADSLQRALLTSSCDIAVIDIMLDPEGGQGIVALLRNRARHMGIVVCSAITCLETRLQCLESGADAYLPKPIDARELATQLRVLSRRLRGSSGMQAHDIRNDWALIEGGWSLRDPSGNKLSLTTAERIFLRALFDRAGQPVPREELMMSLGADPRNADPHRLDVLVNRLRAKAQAANIALPLRSVRSRGYVLAVSSSASRVESHLAAPEALSQGQAGSTGDFSYPAWE